MANIYADAIYAENPASIWALDDTFDSTLTALPGSIALSSLYGSKAYAYGSEIGYGYYIGTSSSGGSLKASSTGIPMVYGSSNITNLYNNSGSPSLIIPGFGFLNEDGKNKRLTLEFWMRAMSSAFYPRRIVGPITGLDGLYINGNILSLRIGNNIGSHHISEWGRPMLVHIYYTGTNAGVLINGESVISISYDYADIEFPTKLNDESKDQDWIGFYAYSDITPLQIDCIAIYPYQIPIDKAKLHFVKAQAVQSPEIKNSSYFDSPIVIDYQVSKYVSNYMYPGNGNWKNGVVNNLITDNQVLSPPNYPLPQLVFENEYQATNDWNEMQGALSGQSTSALSSGELMDNDVFFKIIPDNESNLRYAGYLLFDKFNFLQSPTKAVYGVFEVSSLPTSDELLFRITNESAEYFEAVANSANIVYRFVSSAGNVSSTVSSAITINTKFVAGIDIDAFIAAQSANPQIAAFFNNPSNLRVFLGGPSSFNGGASTDVSKPKLFGGKIYKFAFTDSYNLSKIDSKFSSGIANNTYVATFNSHFATYTLIGVFNMGIFSLDVAISGSWSDYVPLSQFAKTVVKDSGEDYTFDFIQFNIDVPEYLGKLALADAHIRTYVEFSEIAISTVDAIQLSKEDQAAPSNRVVDPGSEWLNKRYEVVNNTIIYKPTGGFNDFEDIGIITHIDFNVPGIYRNPAKLKMLHLSSQALGRSTVPTSIGTKFGKDIYPYGTTSNLRDYSKKNPYVIYKNSTPYLYLTKYSGIQLVGSEIDGTRGIEIPINKDAKLYYKSSVISASVFYDKQFSSNIEIFRIKDNQNTIIIYAAFTDGVTDTVEISAKYANNTTFTDIQYFVNGVADERTIKYGEWNSIGLLFTELLDFSASSAGRIDITGPFLINNISDFQIDQQLETNNKNFNYWSNIQSVGTWSQALSTELTWIGALFSDETQDPPRLDPQDIYNSYLGNNRIFADSSLNSFRINQSDQSVYSDIRSTIIRSIPL